METRKVSANPTKNFFVNMITRDITLEDCILDLIDNSVDSAWEMEGGKPMDLVDPTDLSNYSVTINISDSFFSIRDNCGGMSKEEALHNAFSFGRNTEAHGDFSIGVYGIGMKRAVFKIGKKIKIKSSFVEKEKDDNFEIPIDVDQWLGDESHPWDFDISDIEPMEETGLTINIDSLTKGAEESFSNPRFIQRLKRTISRDYSLHLSRGINITLNGERIKSWHMELRESDDFVPVRKQYIDSDDSGKEVRVEIIGGMAASPPESSDPDEQEISTDNFGWYVICNGRVVLAADKTDISGWGTESWPKWHKQYSGFMGFVLFTASDASALPLTTTKRSVEVSSGVYRRARPEMRSITRDWINYTNQRKQSIEEAKSLESQAKSVSLNKIRENEAVKLPRFIAIRSEPTATINYTLSLDRVKKLARELGNVNMTYREVGMKSFEYTYEDFVGEE